jgi:hypothetical protein
MSIEVAYRAAVAEHQYLRSKAEKMGPILFELREQKIRTRKTPNWFLATLTETSAALRAMLTTMTRIRRLAES